ncbi:hypothetical protein [Cryobacterium sp. M91]|uniref:hypothetical protein n=1 Tax=Cryobacterium sp. M91 TaxID=2048294 RepID=UPI000CE36EBC|nr:hypothetical protein [Cryobacterium sp. M91]
MASIYYLTGMLADDELRISDSTETLLGSIIDGYADLQSETERSVARYDYLVGAAEAAQLGLIEAAVLAGSWSYEDAPAWERDRLLASKRGRAPGRGSVWACSIPLLLVQKCGGGKSRSTRISVAGNTLVLQDGSATQTLIALKHLGMVDTGHLNGPAQVQEPYL